MKFFRYTAIFLIFVLGLISCQKENASHWDTAIDTPKEAVSVTDISGDFFNPSISTVAFKQKYPWFQGTVSDADFEARRSDSMEIKIYKEAIAKINQPQLTNDLSELFARVKFYFPSFKTPKVYLFSSVLQMAKDPIILDPNEGFLFIDISGFMGENNPNYKGIEQYYQKSMQPQNMVPKVSQIIAEQLVPADMEHQKFIDMLIYNGKIMLLQDAFLPKTPDYLKINYTPQQYDWAIANEENIWNYFIENNLIFSDESRLQERFIAPAPFSKFYTAIDNESSPQIGIFIGWQICKAYFEKNPKTPLMDFLALDSETIFNNSGYK